MKICRYDDDRLASCKATRCGRHQGAGRDPRAALAARARGPLHLNFKKVVAAAKKLAPKAKRKPLSKVKLLSRWRPREDHRCADQLQRPHRRVDQGPGIAHGRTNIQRGSATGPVPQGRLLARRFRRGDPPALAERRNDHEVELALVIGKRGSKIPRERALEHVCAYAIGLDMTVRGPELQCFRKSIDTYSVLGPWLVTADEIGDPNHLDLSITVNVRRGRAPTRSIWSTMSSA